MRKSGWNHMFEPSVHKSSILRFLKNVHFSPTSISPPLPEHVHSFQQEGASSESQVDEKKLKYTHHFCFIISDGLMLTKLWHKITFTVQPPVTQIIDTKYIIGKKKKKKTQL